MEDSVRIEKLDNHKYRIYLNWDGTEKMLKELLEEGLSVFDDNGIYYMDEIPKNYDFSIDIINISRKGHILRSNLYN